MVTETDVVRKGIGPVEVYKSREMIHNVFDHWKYHASSSNRFLPNGNNFLGESSKSLEILAKTIFSIFRPKEKIIMITRCPSYDNKIGEDNPSMHIDSNGTIEHYERLDISELEVLGRAISKNRTSQDA